MKRIVLAPFRWVDTWLVTHLPDLWSLQLHVLIALAPIAYFGAWAIAQIPPITPATVGRLDDVHLGMSLTLVFVMALGWAYWLAGRTVDAPMRVGSGGWTAALGLAVGFTIILGLSLTYLTVLYERSAHIVTLEEFQQDNVVMRSLGVRLPSGTGGHVLTRRVGLNLESNSANRPGTVALENATPEELRQWLEVVDKYTPHWATSDVRNGLFSALRIEHAQRLFDAAKANLRDPANASRLAVVDRDSRAQLESLLRVFEIPYVDPVLPSFADGLAAQDPADAVALAELYLQSQTETGYQSIDQSGYQVNGQLERVAEMIGLAEARHMEEFDPVLWTFLGLLAFFLGILVHVTIQMRSLLGWKSWTGALVLAVGSWVLALVLMEETRYDDDMLAGLLLLVPSVAAFAVLALTSVSGRSGASRRIALLLLGATLPLAVFTLWAVWRVDGFGVGLLLVAGAALATGTSAMVRTAGSHERGFLVHGWLLAGLVLAIGAAVAEQLVFGWTAGISANSLLGEGLPYLAFLSVIGKTEFTFDFLVHPRVAAAVLWAVPLSLVLLGVYLSRTVDRTARWHRRFARALLGLGVGLTLRALLQVSFGMHDDFGEALQLVSDFVEGGDDSVVLGWHLAVLAATTACLPVLQRMLNRERALPQ